MLIWSELLSVSMCIQAHVEGGRMCAQNIRNYRAILLCEMNESLVHFPMVWLKCYQNYISLLSACFHIWWLVSRCRNDNMYVVWKKIEKYC